VLAKGATDGSIIAAIMSAHMPTKFGSSQPMVPGTSHIPSARTRVAAAAPAASRNSTTIWGVIRMRSGRARGVAVVIWRGG
jgi:hypothetical protein